MRSLVCSIAIVAVTGFGASVWAANADDTVDQTALAIPRIGMPGAQGVALPRPISPGDAGQVRRVLALRRAGAFTEAKAELDRLDDALLRGPILAGLYVDTDYVPSAAELSAWLTRYGDQPDAPAIRDMLDKRNRRAAAKHAVANARNVNRGGIRQLMVDNKDRAARDAGLAQLPTEAQGAAVTDALLAGGVAAWRLTDVEGARSLFDAAWHAGLTPASRADAAFWAARVADVEHDRGGHTFWLRRAASEAGTFHGWIARDILRTALPCAPPPPPPASSGRLVVTNADVEALMATDQGRRGFALLQVGERARAEAEFRSLWFDSGPRPALGRSLILIANAMGLTSLAAELRTSADAASGAVALPPLRPAGGFRMDPAFVYAVVRHESNFQPRALSPHGARGLMQLMPATAVSLGGIHQGQGDRLNDPATNLAIGQRYLIQLGDNALVGDDLLKLIAAYGQGPTGMNRWAEGIRHNGDPFVFLAAIPSPFMRQFVQDVLLYHWQYAAALRLRASSLEALSTGLYPRFQPIKAGAGGTKARPEACPAPPVQSLAAVFPSR